MGAPEGRRPNHRKAARSESYPATPAPTVLPDASHETRMPAADSEFCAREAIHIPGSIQPHGYLFVLDARDFRVLALSENVTVAVGKTAGAMIGRPIGDFLVSRTAESVDAMLAETSTGIAISVRFRRVAGAADYAGLVHRTAGRVLLEISPRIPAEQAETLFAQVHLAIERIRRSQSTAHACDILAIEIRRLTGFERVMVYRFDPDWNGQVIAEDKAPDAHSYLGHAFPASDIPAQARDLYTRNTVRLIPDTAYIPSPIVPPTLGSPAEPIDLGSVTLRSISPVHLEYLANMGVASSMSVSVLREGKLWALVACHHPSAHFMPHRVLQACELLAQATAWYLDADERRAATTCVAAMRVLEAELTAHPDAKADYRSRLESIAPALLARTNSQGLAICDPHGVWTVGQVPRDEQIIALSAWLAASGERQLTTDRLPGLFPEASAYRAVASGLSALALAEGWLIWFRAEWRHTLTWAGEPIKRQHGGAAVGRIGPRKSFESWTETVSGRSPPWTISDLFAIDQVQLLILRASMVDHDRRGFERSQLESVGQVASGLAHEVGSLLQPIVSMARMTQEDHQGDVAVVEAMDMILQSANRAAGIVRDMLLYVRRPTTNPPRVHLAKAVAIELETLRRGATTDIRVDLDAAETDVHVAIEAGQLGQILKNLINNAVDAAPGRGRIGVGVDDFVAPDVAVAGLALSAGRWARIAITDDGPGIAPAALDHIFEPFFTTKEVGSGTGLGLSIVHGIVESCGGKIVGRNRPEGGAVFDVLLPSVDSRD